MKSESMIALVNRLVPNAQRRAEIFDGIERKEREGYSFHDAMASLELFVLRSTDGKKLPFTVHGYHVSMRGNGSVHICEGIVKVLLNGALYHTVSEGNGPISALNRALRLALEEPFPQLRNVFLEDYSVGLAGERRGADSKTRVRIVTAQGKNRFGTVGVSLNVVEASLLALVDSLEYALLPQGKPGDECS